MGRGKGLGEAQGQIRDRGHLPGPRRRNGFVSSENSELIESYLGMALSGRVVKKIGWEKEMGKITEYLKCQSEVCHQHLKKKLEL